MKTVQVTEVPAGAQLIDVRESDEYAAGHATPAISIPMSEFPERVGEVDTSREVFVICLSGGRSAKVCEYLEAQGISSTNVEGGTSAWQAAGLEMS